MKLARFLAILVLFAGIAPVQAQTPPADLALEVVSLLGDTAVVYRNDGAAISGQAYSISFQWVDASGAALAYKQTLTRSALALRGREVLTWNNTMVEGTIIKNEQRCYTTGGFFNRRTRCDNIQVPYTVSQTLAAYRSARPRPDALLAVMLDDGNRIFESNEGNNAARVGNTPFQGAPPAPVVELVLTRATFDGQNLFVVFQNQSAANISNQPFDVGLQWLNQSGAPVGDRRFNRFKNLLSGKVEIIDSKTEIGVLAQTGPGPDDIAVADSLAAYLASRPANAMKLQITVDDRNQILEISKTNNVAVINLPPPLPTDLAITKQVQIFNAQQLVFSYANLGQAPLTLAPAFSFWFEWVDAKGARVGNNLYWQDRDSRTLPPGVSAVFVSSGAQVLSSLGALPLDKVVQNPPPEAVSLKITIDGPNAFREVDETNNVLILPKLVRPLPDLVLGLIEVKDNVLRVEVQNKGVVLSPPPDLLVQWFGSAGPLRGPMPINATAAIMPSSSYMFSLAFDGPSPVQQLLKNPPPGATRLQLTVDGTRRIAELNEDNNTALVERAILPVRLPDLTIIQQTPILNPQQLVFSFANLSKVPLTQFPALSFWFEWVDAKGARVGNQLYWHDRSAAAVPLDGAISIFDSRGIYVGSAAGAFASLESVLKNPPAQATHLKVTIDGSNRFRESDEDNNIALWPKPVAPLPDLSFGAISGREGILNIEVKNQGTTPAAPTDIWLQWWSASASLGGNVAVQIPAPIAPQAAYVASLTVNAKTPAEWLISNPPQGAVQLRLTVDGMRSVTESNEDNNTATVDRSTIPAIPAVLPELTLTLTTQVMRAQAVSAHAVSPFATAGFVLALFSLAYSSMLMYAHRGNPDMRGKMKKMTRVSLMATVGTGASKLLLSLLAVSVLGPIMLTSAQTGEALIGDQVRANMLVKNIGTLPASGITLFLPCPEGTSWVSTTANGAGQSRNAGEGISMPDLAAGSAHGLSVICKIEAAAAKKGSARFAGSAQIKEGERKFNSNSIDIAIRASAISAKPDLEVGGTGLLAKEEVVQGANLPFEAEFTAIVQNNGKVPVPPTRARLRIDAGADGSWDTIVPVLSDIGPLDPDKPALAKWSVGWVAPLGRYAFEICADADQQISETDETNNCVKDVFTLQAGEEPMFEEEAVE